MMDYLLKIFTIVSRIFIQTTTVLDNQKKIIKTQEEHGLKLAEILYRLTAPLAVKFRFDVFSEDGFFEGVKKMDINAIEQFTITAKPLNDRDKDAPIEGVPTWRSTDEAVATVTPNSDGFSAVVVGVAPGTCQIVTEGDADLSEGVKLITGTTDVNVIQAPATKFQLDVGPAEPQPLPETPENPPA